MKLEEAIQLSLERIRDMVLFCREDGLVIYANASALNLLEYGEQIYQCHISKVFPTLFSEEKTTTQQMQNLLGQTVVVDAYRENRTCFQVEAQFFRQEEDFFEIIAYDATEESYLNRKMEQVQQEAEAAARVKSEFVANITHELRTPVNGILGNILELKEIEQDPAKNRILSLVERGCADMNAIINSILDFSKLEAGKFSLENREFDFREMMENVKMNHRPKTTEKGLDFSISISPEIPDKVIGDELRIVQILNNLISNACKFTTVGRVAVEVVKTSQVADRIELFFLVIDTGIGISKENQDKLFQSFSQVDASISRRFGGTGLGLNIAKQLVELMGGSIHVESEEGKGSMFSFQIWVDVPKDAVAQTTSEQSPMTSYKPNLSDFTSNHNVEAIRSFGTEENLAELERNLNKLILSVEMENWEKAEGFANIMRELTEDAPKEIKNKALRAKMSVQKEDYDKTADAVNDMRELLKM